MVGLYRSPGGMPPVPGPVIASGATIPNRIYIYADGFERPACYRMAVEAVKYAQTSSPKLSGRAAEGISPIAGHGYFGMKWDRPYLWHQEAGITSFTMTRLAGKVIPMWLDDWDGSLARENPKAEKRITRTGRRQVLIFRRAAKLGERRRVAVRDQNGRLLRWREVPKSYPGAPGRITHREWREHEDPNRRTTGRIDFLVSRPHVGVRWRHPGLVPREFMQHALQRIALENGIVDTQVHATYGRS